MPVLRAGYDVVNTILFGEQKQETIDYFRDVNEQINKRTDLFLPEFQKLNNDVFENTYSHRAIELTRAALNKSSSLFSPNVIKELVTLQEFQTAKPMMQRYVMANTAVRELWNKGRIAGYDGEYLDHDKGLIGERHYDYRRVMSGLVQENEDETVTCTEYFQELRDEDEELTSSKQSDIRKSWFNLERILQESDKDPTSIWNSDR